MRTFVVALLGVFVFPVFVHAQIIQNNVPDSLAEVKSQCSQHAVPAGWVVTSFATDTTCGSHNKLNLIKNIIHAAFAQTETICRSSAIPSGWSTTGFVSNAACIDGGSELDDAITIKNLAGASVGQTVTVCNVSGAIPSGWSTTGFVSNAACIDGGSEIDDAVTFQLSTCYSDAND